MTSPSTIEQTADAVRRALASYPPFRHAAAETAVKTSADRIELYGFVRSEAIANSALALARATAGNVAVTSKLIVDNVLEMEASQRLAADSRTAAFPLRVNAYLGRITIVGVLPAAARKTALDIVQGIPGVRAVEEEEMPLTPVEQPVASLFSALTSPA
ncbi:MAG: BON domain-containing protein [Anaerolineae bacterium]|jgi:osmotically-inducible protein OsmY|uniref:BON domain-containing protein n=1 Tax=Candidatus Amarolinea dominans TaxID=3140696 RepID=UPI003136358E|nr:BON domain-containing protein [Anaerolineae bacterium]MBK9095808.1 BON domain-containing protein [Anaerolineae bacterium]MBK9230076.1 BON domain-containing protein [Anaerolineae bacterium]